MERQRHNARGLPEERSNAAASSTSLDNRPPSTASSSAPSTSANQPSAPTSSSQPQASSTNTSSTNASNVLPVQNNMTTAGSGPLPAGWGMVLCLSFIYFLHLTH